MKETQTEGLGYLFCFFLCGAVTIVLSLSLWNVYGLDWVFAIGAVLWLFISSLTIAFGGMLWWIRKTGRGSGATTVIRLVKNYPGVCALCGAKGVVYFPEGKDAVPLLHRCWTHKGTLMSGGPCEDCDTEGCSCPPVE